MDLLYFIVAIVVVLIIKFFYDKKKNRHLLMESLKKQWGKPADCDYTSDYLESIATYFRFAYDKNTDIDDITWHDLNMDDLYLEMNNTASSLGEEYLYSMLHKLEYKKDKLEERNKLIDYFQSNPDKSIEIQGILKYLGKLNRISIFEYMNHFSDVKKDSNIGHISQAIAFLAALFLATVEPKIGVILSVLMLGYNIITYYKRQGQIDKYISVCSYIIRLLSTVEQLNDAKIPEIDFYLNRLIELSKRFKKFRKNSYLVTSKNISGDIGNVIFDYVRMIFHVDLIKFNQMIDIFTNEKDTLNEIFEIVGSIDSLIAVASYRTYLPYYCMPELENKNDNSLYVEEVYHPLIEDAVTNSIDAKSSALITGSNASGKSTFLRSIAINAILSQTIYTSLSKSYKANYFKVMSSMALQDNILGSESYYIVEIKSIKRIMDSVNDRIPVLCFVDEVLRGTNTLERIAASSQILYSFGTSNVICFAATHDIELTHILEEYFENYHFQEEVAENKVTFDYKLHNGRAVSRNAIKLLSMMGYKEEIIASATNNANQFLKDGKWAKLERI